MDMKKGQPSSSTKRNFRLILLLCLVPLIPVSGCSLQERQFQSFFPAAGSTSTDGVKREMKTGNFLPDPGIFKAVMEKNEIYENNRSGVRIRGSLPVRVTECDIHGNGRGGIRIEKNANVYVENSRIYGNQRAGLDARNILRLDCRHLGIFNNQGAGIRIRKIEQESCGETSVGIIESDIFLNGQAGLYAAVSSDSGLHIYASMNQIHENARAGLRVEGRVRLAAAGNDIFSNGTSGVYGQSRTSGFPVLDVVENRIFFNKKAGIFIRGGCTGSLGIMNNWIYNNLESGIACLAARDTYSAPGPINIYHNTIVSNGSRNEGAGVRIDSNATADIANNIIVYNIRTGLLVTRCGDFSSNLIFANGQIPEFNRDRDHAFLSRRMQYGGCPSEGRGDILADPRFSDPDNYDFSILDTSPAVDAGKYLDIPYLKTFDHRCMGALLVPGMDKRAACP